MSAAAELLEHATVAWSRPEGFAALLHTHPPALMVKGGGDALPVADLSEPYRLSDAARGDLVEIEAHSATVNVAAAAGVADDIEATCQLLGSIPASVFIVTSWALE
ncbi:hypothetical protein [Gemmatimonas sp.]|uniref:hypothetical protein n=1 Tax=Gemmatimonas sp. TaxID=1962908 RepID=UPI003DA33107